MCVFDNSVGAITAQEIERDVGLKEQDISESVLNPTVLDIVPDITFIPHIRIRCENS